jgi:hypothetical protein
MLRCGATFDENSVPHWTRGDFRGVECGNKPTPVLRGTPPTEGIFSRAGLLGVEQSAPLPKGTEAFTSCVSRSRDWRSCCKQRLARFSLT